MPLRVATYNIHAGSGMDNVFDLDRQTAQLRALDADVIGLQEVDVHWDARSQSAIWPPSWRNGWNACVVRPDLQPRSPTRRRRDASTASRCCPGTGSASAENHEITRLSTQDPEPGARRRRPASARWSYGEGACPCTCTRRTSTTGPTRPYGWRRSPTPGGSWRGGPARARQVLLGDFNAEPGAPELAPLWNELAPADPGAPTFPAEDPVKRIDFVAVVEGRRAGTRRGGGRDARLGPPPGCRRSGAPALKGSGSVLGLRVRS